MAAEHLDRRAVAAALVAKRKDLLVVSGLGSPSWDLAAAGDHDLNFYLWGAMGGAAVMGLGLALAQPARPVLVLTGDGEMLMGLGSLATVAAAAPANLAIVVLDNQRYGETGMQASHTAHGSDLAAIAKAAGIADSRRVTDRAGVDGLAERIARPEGCLFAVVPILAEEPPKVLPPRDAVLLKTRFRSALGLAVG
jgi:thiamine pyrophosphate-dependent acetolactate synthase large subunit-like protein